MKEISYTINKTKFRFLCISYEKFTCINPSAMNDHLSPIKKKARQNKKTDIFLWRHRGATKLNRTLGAWSGGDENHTRWVMHSVLLFLSSHSPIYKQGSGRRLRSSNGKLLKLNWYSRPAKKEWPGKMPLFFTSKINIFS